MQPETQRWYTVEEVAQMFSVHPETIRRQIKQKKLKALRLGGEYRISQTWLDEFIAKNEWAAA